MQGESKRPKKRLRPIGPGMPGSPSSLSLLASVATTSSVPTNVPMASMPFQESAKQAPVIRKVSLTCKDVPPTSPSIFVPGKPEEIAVEGVSMFMREMKSSRPEEIANAMNTLALCLRTELRMHRNDYATTLFAVNGYKVVQQAMKQWGEVEALQKAGCTCLRMMTEHGHDKAVASATILGTMEVVTQAMIVFPRSYSIQRNALATLDNCCDQFCVTDPTGTTTKVSKKTYQTFVELQCQGVKLAVQAMTMYPGKLDLQVQGSSLIHTMSTRKECWQALKEQHALSAVTLAFENHSYNDDIKGHLQNIMDNMLL